jgi:hypothetical protein
MKTLPSLVLVVLLAACTTVATKKVDSGDNTLGDRLQVSIDGPWNQITVPNMGPAFIWTMEGLPVDQLRIYSGIKDGEVIHDTRNSNLKSFSFRSNMQSDELVSMFEGMLTRDGSTFQLTKVEPSSFGGGKGVRFEYAMVTKEDSLPLTGVGYATVNNSELFALLYNAPRLGFFPRHQARVEQIARSAKIIATPVPAKY